MAIFSNRLRHQVPPKRKLHGPHPSQVISQTSYKAQRSVPLTMQPAGRDRRSRVIYADVSRGNVYTLFLFPQPFQQRLKVHGFHDRIFMCCAKRLTDLRNKTAAESPAYSAGNIPTQQIQKCKTKSHAPQKISRD